jgi:hypothetical protein
MKVLEIKQSIGEIYDISQTYNKEVLLLLSFFKQERKTSFSKALRERNTVKAGLGIQAKELMR